MKDIITVYKCDYMYLNNTVIIVLREHNQPVNIPKENFIYFSFIQNITKNLPLFSMN
jgi:hypothetical protein